MPVFPGIKTPGPVMIFVNTGYHTEPEYLGDCQSGIEIVEKYEDDPVFVDLGGTKVPYDTTHQGEQHFVTGVLTLDNELVWERVVHRRNGLGARRPTDTNRLTLADTSPVGADMMVDLGSVYAQEGLMLELWLLFGRRTNATMFALGMPPGRHYFQARLMGPTKARYGTRAMERELIIHATPKTIPIEPNNIRRRLYDFDMTAVAATSIFASVV